MNRELRWNRQAAADFDRLTEQLRDRVLAALERLAETGHGDLSKLRGRQNQWRLRVGDWRVIITFAGHGSIIRVLRVQHRREAYR